VPYIRIDERKRLATTLLVSALANTIGLMTLISLEIEKKHKVNRALRARGMWEEISGKSMIGKAERRAGGRMPHWRG
jgi:hypothetical protein